MIPKSKKIFHKALTIILVFAVGNCLFLAGFYVGQYTEKAEEQRLRENIDGGRYYVIVDYVDLNGKLTSAHLRSTGCRWPVQKESGEVQVKEGPPFITWKRVGYDIGNLLLVDAEESTDFNFSFSNAPPPDSITVRRWPRSEQGTTGTLGNGEVLEYIQQKENLYYVNDLEIQYIYSIFCTWGPYYGEYAFLVSDREEDRAWWSVEP